MELKKVDKVARRPRWFSYKTGDQTYENSVEEQFAEFESSFTGVLSGIRSDIAVLSRRGTALATSSDVVRGLPRAAREYLASYIVLHIARVPSSYETILEMAAQEHERSPELVEVLRKRFGVEHVGNTALWGFMHTVAKLAPFGIGQLMGMNVRVMYSARRRWDIITCDQPVLRGEHLEDVMFPLYQRALIQFSGKGSSFEYRKIELQDLVETLNYQLCGIAVEEVFASSKETLIRALERVGLKYKLVEPT